jgi:hypothetical protein
MYSPSVCSLRYEEQKTSLVTNSLAIEDSRDPTMHHGTFLSRYLTRYYFTKSTFRNTIFIGMLLRTTV